MSGSPWFGVLAIAAVFGGGLFLLLMLAKAQGLRNALTERFRLPILAALCILALVGSVLILNNGIRTGAVFTFLLAINLCGLSDEPRSLWARILLWLSGAQLAAVTALSGKDIRTFPTDDIVDQALTLFVLAAVLYGAVASLISLFRPKAAPPTPTAETGTPA